MTLRDEKISLDHNLDHYRYDARHWPAQGHARFIDYNFVQGIDFAYRCPSWQFEMLDAYGLSGKCNIVYQLLQGDLDYASPTLLEVAYQCFLCGSCDVAGKRNSDFELQMMLESLRVRLVEKGHGPLPAHQSVTGVIEQSGNRFGYAADTRHAWVRDEAPPTDKADLLYFVGDLHAYEDKAAARATAVIIKRAGLDYMLLADEIDCGEYMLMTGQLEKARGVAETVLKRLRQSGAATVVFSDAEVYKAVKVDYPKMLGIATADLGFECKHIVELVDAWLTEGRLKFVEPVEMKVTYHDPDGLGRMSEPWTPWQGERVKWGVFNPTRIMRRAAHGVYDAPRGILRAIPGLELVEMVRHHENAFSVSGGGGADAFPNFAAWAAAERMREAAETGAEALVTADAAAMLALNDAAEGLAVYDITELITRALG